MAEEEVKLLCTKDGQELTVGVGAASQSVVLAQLIEDGGAEGAIPIQQIDKPTMEKVMEYCNHIRENEPPLIDAPL